MSAEGKVSPVPHKGHLVGPEYSAEKVAGIMYRAGFTDAEDLVMAVSVAFAECGGYVGSYCDDFSVEGGPVTQRDVGLMQIGIAAHLIGTQRERDLLDPVKNAAEAFRMWKVRGWQPWSSYNTGIVFDDRYQASALLGVFNYLAWVSGRWQKRVTDPARTPNHLISATTDPRGSNGVAAPLISVPQFRTHYPGIPI